MTEIKRLPVWFEEWHDNQLEIEREVVRQAQKDLRRITSYHESCEAYTDIALGKKRIAWLGDAYRELLENYEYFVEREAGKDAK